jgi:cobalt-zinc-cadmium efflux system membrane fusion protein
MFAIVLFAASCGQNAKQDDSSTEKNDNNAIISFTEQQANFADIQTGYLQKIELADKVSCKGLVKASAENKAKVSAPYNGYVKKILVDYNEYVKENAPLVTLQHKSYIDMQKEYLQVTSKLAFMEKEYDRQKTLKESNASAAKEFQKAEAEYKSLKAEKSALEQQLQLINIRPDKVDENNITNTITVYSPIKGFINDINISIGQFVTPENEMIDMLNRDNFKLSLQVFEKDIHKIQEGQKVHFSCSNPQSKNQINVANVISIAQSVNEQSKTFSVLAKPITCYRNLRDGLFINAVIFTETDSVWALPSGAIINKASTSYFFIAKDSNSFKRKSIITGRNENGFTEIINPEKIKNLPIVVKGVNYLQAELNK